MPIRGHFRDVEKLESPAMGIEFANVLIRGRYEGFAYQTKRCPAHRENWSTIHYAMLESHNQIVILQDRNLIAKSQISDRVL